MSLFVRCCEHIATIVLGPRCGHGCGYRVFPQDRTDHAQYCYPRARSRWS